MPDEPTGDDRMTVLGETARVVGRFFDLKADDYEKRMSSPYWRLMREITWQHVRRFLPREKGASVLDAGGATGYWSLRLAEAGYRVVLVDASEGMLALAAEKVRRAGLSSMIEIVRGDITDMREFSEGAFDAALAVEEPLSFCGDADMAAAELALVTKPGGMVAASVVNRFKVQEFEKYLKKGDVDGLAAYVESGILEKADEAGGAITIRTFRAEDVEALFHANSLDVVSAVGKPVFAGNLGGRLADPPSFSRILQMELAHNGERSLWGSADVLEFVAIKA